MSDLIDRQAAIDAIDRIFDRCEEIENHFRKDDPDRTGYRMLPDYFTVRNFITQEQRWIPVAERLPEIDMSYPHHEDYLVQYDSGGMDVASWSNTNRFWTDHVTEPHWNCVQFAEVIAWMPLPEPYQEGEKQ